MIASCDRAPCSQACPAGFCDSASDCCKDGKCVPAGCEPGTPLDPVREYIRDQEGLPVYGCGGINACGGKCVNETCGAGRACRGGECVCVSDAGCGAGEACTEAGKCSCADDAACGPGRRCAAKWRLHPVLRAPRPAVDAYGRELPGTLGADAMTKVAGLLQSVDVTGKIVQAQEAGKRAASALASGLMQRPDHPALRNVLGMDSEQVALAVGRLTVLQSSECACTSDKGCPQYHLCSGGECRCRSDDACPGKGQCVDGECVACPTVSECRRQACETVNVCGDVCRDCRDCKCPPAHACVGGSCVSVVRIVFFVSVALAFTPLSVVLMRRGGRQRGGGRADWPFPARFGLMVLALALLPAKRRRVAEPATGLGLGLACVGAYAVYAYVRGRPAEPPKDEVYPDDFYNDDHDTSFTGEYEQCAGHCDGVRKLAIKLLQENKELKARVTAA